LDPIVPASALHFLPSLYELWQAGIQGYGGQAVDPALASLRSVSAELVERKLLKMTP